MITDDMLDADIAILAKKGRGKTYTAKGLVERLLRAEKRVLVLDPLSTWWGLKSSADGENEGFPVAVFGGPHGDMPMTEAMARPLAQIIAKGNLPAVVDLGSLPKAAWQRIVRDMLDELFQRNRDPLWIVLEEADVFAPQQPREGDSAAVLGEVDRIARRGRAFGFRLISITQRPARLHKDVLTQLSTLIALGVTSPQDREAVKSWVEGNADRDKAREVMDSLASLPVGEGWVWAPDFDVLERTRFPLITTLDTSATPRAGERRIEPKRLAQIDLDPLRAALKVDVSEPVKTEERSAIWNKARAEGYEAGLVDGERTGRAKERARIMIAVNAALRVDHDPEAPPLVTAHVAPAAAPKPGKARTVLSNHANGLPLTAARMLDALDTNPPIRMSWNSLAASVGNKARGGHFNSMRKALLDGRHVIEEGSLVRHAAPSDTAAPPMSGADLARHLRNQWKSMLGGRAAQIIGLLEDGPASKPEIAARLGCAPHGGHWNAAWKSLRDNDLIAESNGQMILKGDLA